MEHRSAAELAAGLPDILRSPAAVGTVEMIVRRPAEDAREVLAAGELTPDEGLAGDHWKERGSRSMPDGSADPERQLTFMNARVIELLAGGDRGAWPLAGDQLYVDLDLSEANLPAGTRLALGTAVVEVTPPPHTGCAKFSARFGSEGLRFVNTPEGRALRLRGLHARVIEAGVVHPGDAVSRL
jgi:hypothetical protein